MRIKILIKIITCFLGIVILYFNYLNPPTLAAEQGAGWGAGAAGVSGYQNVNGG